MKCGREAVAYFAECFHLGKVESMFFNVAPGRHYEPYTLIEVSSDKVCAPSVTCTLLLLSYHLCSLSFCIVH